MKNILTYPGTFICFFIFRDLSDNQITQIEAGAFLGLDNLLRL